MLGNAVATLAQNAERVGFVYHQPGLITRLDVNQPRQVGIVPVHAVETLDHDHCAFVFAAVGGQYLLEIVEIVMGEAAARRARKARCRRPRCCGQRHR